MYQTQNKKSQYPITVIALKEFDCIDIKIIVIEPGEFNTLNNQVTFGKIKNILAFIIMSINFEEFSATTKILF